VIVKHTSVGLSCNRCLHHNHPQFDKVLVQCSSVSIRSSSHDFEFRKDLKPLRRNKCKLKDVWSEPWSYSKMGLIYEKLHRCFRFHECTERAGHVNLHRLRLNIHANWSQEKRPQHPRYKYDLSFTSGCIFTCSSIHRQAP